jgi:hypothetical protein
VLAASDYVSSKDHHWVPILGILCDGEKFDFFVFDSWSKSVYSPENVTGVFDVKGKHKLFVSSLKETAEYIFLMAYINGLRSFSRRSELLVLAAQSRSNRQRNASLPISGWRL